jgi:hypothetical protein
MQIKNKKFTFCFKFINDNKKLINGHLIEGFDVKKVFFIFSWNFYKILPVADAVTVTLPQSNHTYNSD